MSFFHKKTYLFFFICVLLGVISTTSTPDNKYDTIISEFRHKLLYSRHKQMLDLYHIFLTISSQKTNLPIVYNLHNPSYLRITKTNIPIKRYPTNTTAPFYKDGRVYKKQKGSILQRRTPQKRNQYKRQSCIFSIHLLFHSRDFGKNVVILSSGCSGTLLSAQFVLTAAHCVHNGRTSFRNLKVIIQETIWRQRIHYVKHIIVPKGWLLVDNLVDTERYADDYAVLKLAFQVEGQREFMKLKAPDTNSMTFDMYYMGFTFLKKELKFSLNTCPWETGRLFSSRNLIRRVCGSRGGHSGSAVFTYNRVNGIHISGIVSHARIIKSNLADRSYGQWTVIAALTESKIKHICSIVQIGARDTGGSCDMAVH